MKWWHCILLGVVLTLIFGLPFREYQTQQLLPIKTVQAERTAEGIHIVSEVGEGIGATWNDAVEDLRENAAGDVFFDTAEQAVFSDQALAQEAADSGILRPAAQVYFAKELLEPETLNAYLTAHPSDRKISDYSTAAPVSLSSSRHSFSAKKGYTA